MILILFYNWKGTVEEREKWEQYAKDWHKKNDMKVIGMYTPSCPWNRAWLIETNSLDKAFKFEPNTDKLLNTDLIVLS